MWCPLIHWITSSLTWAYSFRYILCIFKNGFMSALLRGFWYGDSTKFMLQRRCKTAHEMVGAIEQLVAITRCFVVVTPHWIIVVSRVGASFLLHYSSVRCEASRHQLLLDVYASSPLCQLAPRGSRSLKFDIVRYRKGGLSVHYESVLASCRILFDFSVKLSASEEIEKCSFTLWMENVRPRSNQGSDAAHDYEVWRRFGGRWINKQLWRVEKNVVKLSCIDCCRSFTIATRHSTRQQENDKQSWRSYSYKDHLKLKEVQGLKGPETSC